MKTKRKAIRRIDNGSFANKSRKISDFPDVDVAHLDDVVPGSSSYGLSHVDSNFAVDAAYMVSGASDESSYGLLTNQTCESAKGKRKLCEVYVDHLLIFQDKQLVPNVTEHLSVPSYRSTSLIINEQDPVSASAAIAPLIGKGKGTVDDLYNSSIHASVDRTQTEGVSSSTYHINNNNNNNNNVHVNDGMRGRLSNLVAIENERLSPSHVSADSHYQTTASAIQPTEFFSVSGSQTSVAQPAAEITRTANTPSSLTRRPAHARHGRAPEITRTANTPSSFNRRPAHARRARATESGSTSSNVPRRGPPEAYVSLGSCDRVCSHCKAFFWYDEKLKSSSQRSPEYTRCCMKGRVVLRPQPVYPPYILQLFTDRHFMENIRAYNQMFAMTSLGAHIDESINRGRGPYVFKVSGQIYHQLGSLCPQPETEPRFLQLYIFDTANEVANRLHHFAGENTTLRPDIVENLIEVLDDNNGLVQLFRTARDKMLAANVPEFKIRLFGVAGSRQYELPCGDCIGAIIFEGGPDTQTDYDVIIEQWSGEPQRINKLHPCYMSLQFPLLFIFGEEGYHPGLRLVDVTGASSADEKKMSMKMYYAYQFHDRFEQYSLLTRGGRLFQQYVVTAYCSVEQYRLDFIREHQNDIRNEYLSGLYDAIFRGDRDGSDVGSRTILPSSFVGGPRYMYSHYLDALAICRVHGNPSFFITFTCNVNWPEIQEFMERFPYITVADRPDAVDRVFEQKIHHLISYLRDQRPFGPVQAVLYTVEFQKRGLPHCHLLLWVRATSRVHMHEEIDRYVSAQIPNRETDPEGYRVVSELMMHGPCGLANKSAPCMKNTDACTKGFPKPYCNSTFVDDKGIVHYQRQHTGSTVVRQNVELDNSYVVPYNLSLCMRFYAHINVEYCEWTMLIKYLFKYISKGTDRIVAQVTRPIGEASTSSSHPVIHVDEIKNFQDARYVGPHEACWRILGFDIHYREPAVQILAVHLENMQRVFFRGRERIQTVVDNPTNKKTTLTEWLHFNSQSVLGHHLTYLEFPSEFVWHSTDKYWSPRQHRSKPSIGRLAYIHPSAGDLFYQRMLLCHQKGCRSFREIRTVNGQVYSTNRAACEALGLLADDREWTTALQEAQMSASAAVSLLPDTYFL